MDSAKTTLDHGMKNNVGKCRVSAYPGKNKGKAKQGKIKARQFVIHLMMSYPATLAVKKSIKIIYYKDIFHFFSE